MAEQTEQPVPPPPSDSAGTERSPRRGISLAAWPLILLVRLYQLTLRPVMGAQCRYLPTCSDYALEALTVHGAMRGSWLTVRRLLRCQPWGGQGYDPVPPRDS